MIEVDGGRRSNYASEGMAYDSERSAVLQGYQLTVIRVSNADIDRNFPGVCEMMDQRIKEELLKWED